MDILDKKCFKNKICQDCIAKNIQKYGKFDIQCSGITVEDDVALQLRMVFLRMMQDGYMIQDISSVKSINQIQENIKIQSCYARLET